MDCIKARLVPYSIPELEFSSVLNLTAEILKGKFHKGTNIEKLEKQFAELIGTRYAIAFGSGRFSQYLLFKYYLSKSQNKNVLLPSYTCIPAVDSARWAGAIPKFTDIELDNYGQLFDEEKVNECSVIMLSHIYGLVGNLQPFLNYAGTHNIPIIEDAAIALGAEYKGMKIGTIGDSAMFSFQASKILTSFRGGIITTDNPDLFEFLNKERQHLKKPGFFKLAFNLYFSYLRSILSSSYVYGWTMFTLKKIMTSPVFRGLLAKILNQNPTEAADGISPQSLPGSEKVMFTNAQAAMILPSLNKLKELTEKRQYMADKLAQRFKDNHNIRFPFNTQDIKHAYGRFPVRIPGISKKQAFDFMLKNGSEGALNYPYTIPNTIFMQQFKDKEYQNAELAAKETFLIPCHTFMTDSDLNKTADAVLKLAKKQ